MPIISNRQDAPADWQALHVALNRCCEGPPAGKVGTFTGTVLTLCQMLCGDVFMEKEGCSIETDSRETQWIVCQPGERYQRFSADARIISVHFATGNPGNGAQWSGPALVGLHPERQAQQALAQLQRCPALRGLPREQALSLYGLRLPLERALDLQERTTRLFRLLLGQLAKAGMHFTPPPIEDERVRRSHRHLAALDIREAFSRTELARSVGLTAGQLDRLWRAQLGLTPRQYRDRLRLDYACRQLRRHAPSIKSVASDLGFAHLSQFSNWFRQRQGESPRHFRQRPNSA